jgi:multidrug efflux pump subunit AcrA (membrane-fusion protein)
MSETTTTPDAPAAEVAATSSTPPPATPPPATTDTGAALLAELDKWKTMARKHEDRAKANADAAKRVEALQAELEQFRAASMSEAEKATAKAVKEAEQRARAEALGAVGQRLVRAEFRAQAAGAIPDLDGVLDDLNLAKFVGADGEPDTAAISAAVKRLTPPKPAEPEAVQPVTAPGPRPDLTQGSRLTMPLNGDPLLAAVKSKLGIPG